MWGRLSADFNKQNSKYVKSILCVCVGGGQVIFALEIVSSQLFNQARC